MIEFKFIHTADWHLGSAFGALSKEKARERKTHLWQSIDRMLALAESEEADAFLIAGDLFEDQNVSLSDARTVFKKLGALSMPVFIAAGNHDPLVSESYYQTLELPGNVHVFPGDRVERIEVKPGVYLYGRSFAHRYEADLLGGFTADLTDGELGVMLIHGDVSGSGDYNPVKREVIEKSGLAYWALGHIHAKSEPERIGKSTVAYPGAPEGRGFDELGEMGVYVGEVTSEGTDLRFVPIAGHRYEAFTVDISSLVSEEEIRTLIISRMGENARNNLYKIVLTGAADFGFSCKNLQESLSGEAYFVKVKNQTRRKAGSAEEWSPLAEKMKEYIEAADADEEIRALALYLGQAALSGRKVDILED